MIGTTEWIVIIAVIALLFGATQIPKLMRSLGEGMKEFKKAVKESKEDENGDKKKPESINSSGEK